MPVARRTDGRFCEILNPSLEGYGHGNPACGPYGRDASAYRNSCAAGITAKSFNPFHGGRRKRFPRPELGETLGSIHTAAAIRLIWA